MFSFDRSIISWNLLVKSQWRKERELVNQRNTPKTYFSYADLQAQHLNKTYCIIIWRCTFCISENYFVVHTVIALIKVLTIVLCLPELNPRELLTKPKYKCHHWVCSLSTEYNLPSIFKESFLKLCILSRLSKNYFWMFILALKFCKD